jgi:hypothetical protein
LCPRLHHRSTVSWFQRHHREGFVPAGLGRSHPVMGGNRRKMELPPRTQGSWRLLGSGISSPTGALQLHFRKCFVYHCREIKYYMRRKISFIPLILIQIASWPTGIMMSLRISSRTRT